MSGFKKALVTISEEEYRRLHSAEMERIYRQNNATSEQNRGEHASRQMRQHLHELEQRQLEYESIIQSFHGTVQAVEAESQELLFQQQVSFNETLHQQINNFWENSHRVEQILADFHAQHERDVQLLQNHTFHTNQQINAMATRQREKYDLVISWLESAGTLGQFIYQQYDHERFTPGRFQQIYQGLEQAEQNIQSGMPEAALVQVQQTYRQLSSLRLELEQLSTEWQSLYKVTYRAAKQLYQHIQNTHSCNALDLDGKPLAVQLNLKEWTNGRWDMLTSRLDGFISSLLSEKNLLTAQDLSFILEKQLKGFQTEFENLIYETRLAALNAHLREEIAETALQSLQTQGYAQSESGYEAGDPKKAFLLKMKDGAGNEVIIRVEPVNDVENKNDLIVETQDAEWLNERELRGRFNEIRQSLEQNGLRVGNVQENTQQTAIPAGFKQNQRTTERTRVIENDRANR